MLGELALDLGDGVPAQRRERALVGLVSTMPVSADTSSATPSPARRDSAGFVRPATGRSARCDAPPPHGAALDAALLRSRSIDRLPSAAMRSERHSREMTPARLERMQAVRVSAGAVALREHLAAVGDVVRIHRPVQPLHAVHVVGPVHLGEERALLEADAVLAGDRAAERDAHPQDLGGQRLGAIVRAGDAAVEEDQRVQVAVAGVEDVGDAHAVPAADSCSMRTSASPSRLRGTTPSCTMKSELRRPTAENADLRPFQIASRSSAFCAMRTW